MVHSKNSGGRSAPGACEGSRAKKIGGGIRPAIEHWPHLKTYSIRGAHKSPLSSVRAKKSRLANGPADIGGFLRELGSRTSNHRVKTATLITFETNDDHLPLSVC
jgi:hypothetical protein